VVYSVTDGGQVVLIEQWMPATYLEPAVPAGRGTHDGLAEAHE
jgi:hypothetical protein